MLSPAQESGHQLGFELLKIVAALLLQHFFCTARAHLVIAAAIGGPLIIIYWGGVVCVFFYICFSRPALAAVCPFYPDYFIIDGLINFLAGAQL